MATSAIQTLPPEESRAVTRIPGGEKGAFALVIAAAERIAPLLPPGHTIDQVAASVYLACRKDPKIMECTGESIVQAVTKIAQWGLEVGHTAHIVPFKGTATPIADYKGIAQLMQATGAVRAIETRVVRDGDAFDYALGLSPRLEHQPTAKSSAKITHAYCILTLRFGYKTLHVMDADEIDAIRKQYSKQWSGGALPAWYAMKTVLRQAAKLIPTSPRLAAVMRVVEDDTDLEAMETAEARVYPARATRVEPDDTPTAPAAPRLLHGVPDVDRGGYDEETADDDLAREAVAPAPAVVPDTVEGLRDVIMGELDASGLSKQVSMTFWTLATKTETVPQLQDLLARVRVKAQQAGQRAAS